MIVDVYIENGVDTQIISLIKSYDWNFTLNWHEHDGGIPVSGRVCLKKMGPSLECGAGRQDIVFNWTKWSLFWNKDRQAHKKSSLIKALGAKVNTWVIDATMGLGKDTSFLLFKGLKVHAFERNHKIFFLQQVAHLINPNQNLEIHFGQACDSELSIGAQVYFDPMFIENKQRKTKAQKGMELFHSIIGPDIDAVDIALKLRQRADRVVIKRAPRNKPIMDNVNSTWESKAVCFDLYL